MKTGQTSMHAPQLVQDQMASSVTVPSFSSPMSGCAGALPACIAAPLCSRFTLMSCTTSRGLSGLPVFVAGQTSWQRPHSVQE